MKNYIKYFIVSLLVLFCYTLNTNALDCYYAKTNSDNTSINAHFRINENNGKIVFSGVAGMLEDEENPKSRRDISDNIGQKIENWNGVFNPFSEIGTKIDFIGKNYYTTNNSCPPYVVVVDREIQLDLIVADDKNNILEKVKNYGEKKTRYAVLNQIYKNNDTRINYPVTCLGLNQASCNFNYNFACVWNEKKVNDLKYKYCNVDDLIYVSCGDAKDIPIEVPGLISFLVNLLKIVTPIILIFISIITLVKALASQKEDEIKKAQTSLIKKIIAAVLVFFVISIVQFIISKVADVERTDENGNTEKDHFSNCLTCFLNNDCEKTAYYKTSVSDIEICTYLSSGKSDFCNQEYNEFNPVKGEFEQNENIPESCSGTYFTNGYQPQSIIINSQCYILRDSGIDAIRLYDNKTITIWEVYVEFYDLWNKTDTLHKKYYWDGRNRVYVDITEMSTSEVNKLIKIIE